MAEPDRLDVLRTLRVANLDGAFSTAFGTLLGGAFLVGFIKFNGGGDLWIGLLSAIPSLLGVLQIPGAIWGRSFGSYKRFILPGGLLWRTLYLPLIALPLISISGADKLNVLATITILASSAILIVNPIYNDWLAEIVPPQSRGAFFSKRNALVTAVGAGIGIGGGVLLDSMQRSHRAAAGFSIIFGLGCFFAFLSFSFFLRMQDTVRVAPVREGLWQGVLAFGTPFRDRRYRSVLIFLAAAVFAQGFPGALFSAYAIETLRLPFTIIQLAGACQALGTVLSFRFWGFASDKYGNKPVLILVGLLLALNPIPWILAEPNSIAFDACLLLTTHVLMGVFWGGVNLCQFNIMLSTANETDRANYLGAGMAVTALVGGAAPLLGASMMASLRPFLGAQQAYQWVFGATIALRAGCVLFLGPVREAGSARVGTTFHHLRTATPTGMKAFRKFSHSANPEARVEALEALGEEKFALASDEMVKALNDPLPGVRREAVRALVRVRDPKSMKQAAFALMRRLEDQPDLADEETIEALGQMEEPSAVEPLIGMLRSPRSLVRRAAARALGHLGNPLAVHQLIEIASDDDPDLRRVAMQSLRRLGAKEAEGVIGAGVMDLRPSVRLAAAEAVSELELISVAPLLRQSMAQYPDEVASAVAYALGTVGEAGDLRSILEVAKSCASTVMRRQALLGAAKLLKVEKQAYRLLLLEGMARDTALVELLRPTARRNGAVRHALTLYSVGDEFGALAALGQAIPSVAELATTCVEEGFLVAASAAAAS